MAKSGRVGANFASQLRQVYGERASAFGRLHGVAYTHRPLDVKSSNDACIYVVYSQAAISQRETGLAAQHLLHQHLGGQFPVNEGSGRCASVQRDDFGASHAQRCETLSLGF